MTGFSTLCPTPIQTRMGSLVSSYSVRNLNMVVRFFSFFWLLLISGVAVILLFFCAKTLSNWSLYDTSRMFQVANFKVYFLFIYYAIAFPCTGITSVICSPILFMTAVKRSHQLGFTFRLHLPVVFFLTLMWLLPHFHLGGQSSEASVMIE
jgi:hypothetical protein